MNLQLEEYGITSNFETTLADWNTAMSEEDDALQSSWRLPCIQSRTQDNAATVCKHMRIALQNAVFVAL